MTFNKERPEKSIWITSFKVENEKPNQFLNNTIRNKSVSKIIFRDFEHLKNEYEAFKKNIPLKR